MSICSPQAYLGDVEEGVGVVFGAEGLPLVFQVTLDGEGGAQGVGTTGVNPLPTEPLVPLRTTPIGHRCNLSVGMRRGGGYGMNFIYIDTLHKI